MHVQAEVPEVEVLAAAVAAAVAALAAVCKSFLLARVFGTNPCKADPSLLP